MAKTQGKVISESIKEAKKGMPVVYKFCGDDTVAVIEEVQHHGTYCQIKRSGGNISGVDINELKQLFVMQIIPGHINKPVNGTFDVTKDKIVLMPLKFSQWQAAIDNGEVDSDKWIEFEIISKPVMMPHQHYRNTEIEAIGQSIKIAKIIPAKKKLYDEDEVIALLVKERKRAVDVAYYFRDKALASYESKKKAGSQVAFVDKSIAEECRYIGNSISGLNGLSAALGETIETIVAKEFKKKNEKA